MTLLSYLIQFGRTNGEFGLSCLGMRGLSLGMGIQCNGCGSNSRSLCVDWSLLDVNL
jgi:hypothetical protein